MESPIPLTPALAPLADRYEFLSELGRGGMAVVYLARVRATGEEVAVKMVGGHHAEDEDARQRFAREARTVATLRHPNVVRTLAVEALDGGATALVTAYVHGETLRAVLRAEGALPVERAASILRDVAGALAHAHAQRIVHRDVKPENVFLEAGTGRALLADFGIARSLDAEELLTAVGASLGTPAYMAPEQAAGRPIDPRADVYALGMVAWEMLAGTRPWPGESLYALLHKQQFELPPDLGLVRPDTPVYLLRAIEGALSKDPAQRWRDGTELLEQLTPRPVPLALPEPAGSAGAGDGAGGEGSTVRFLTPSSPADPAPGVPEPPTAGAPPPPPPRRTPLARGRRPIALAGALGLAAILAVGTVLGRPRPNGDLAGALRGDTVTLRAPDPGLPAEAVAAPATASSQAADTGAVATTAARSTRDSAAGALAAPRPVARSPRPGADPRSPAPVPRATPGPATTAGAVAPRAPSGPAARTGAARPAPSASPPVASGVPRAPACASPTAADQRTCLLAAIARDDAALTRSYQALIGEMRRAAGGASEPAAVRALRAEQRSWLVTRDAECRARTRTSEGPLWGAARAPCFAERSADRARELDARRARFTTRP